MAERKRLGELLLEAKIINATQLQSAIAHQKQWGVRLGTALIEKGFVDEETLAKFLAAQRGMNSVVLSKLKIPPEVLKRIPREMQEKHLVVPIAVEKVGNRETLIVAMADPSNLQALDELRFAIGSAKIKPVIAVEAAIKKVIHGDSRAFRPALNQQPAEQPSTMEVPKETTGEFQIVRGTVESTVSNRGPKAAPAAAPPPTPASVSGRESSGVADAPVGEAVLDLDSAEITDIEPASLEDADFEPIITHVGPPPSAPAPPPAVAPPRAASAPPAAAPDPFLDALRGPPKRSAPTVPDAAAPPPTPPPVAPTTPPSQVATATAAPRAMLPENRPSGAGPSAPSRPAAVAPAAPPSMDVTAPVSRPPASRGIAAAAAVAPRTTPVPAVSPFEAPVEDRTETDLAVSPEAPPALPPMPVESPFDNGGGSSPWDSAPQAPPPGDVWSEPSSETPFEPMAEAAPWPAAPAPMDTASGMDTVPGGIPDGIGATDLGPGAIPVMASGASPLESSVPEISLPGPEMPTGLPPARIGAFDPDTAPELDVGPAAAGAGMFAIPSGLEVQEGSISELAPPVTEPDALAPPPAFEQASSPMEATAADEPMPPVEPYPPVEDGFAPVAPAMPTRTEPDYEPPPDAFAETNVGANPALAASADSLESTVVSVSSSAGAVPGLSGLLEPNENPEATRLGAGHDEPMWDAPMELSAPPEGSVVGATELAPPTSSSAATMLRPEMEEDRLSETRESPFPLGAEPVREAAMLSPMHVDEPLPPMPDEPPPMSAPSREATPPTQQSSSMPIPDPIVRAPASDAVAPPAMRTEPTPEPTPAAVATVSDEQAALNALITKKLKLLNAITELLMEKGLISEEDIKEKISKKKG